MKRTIILCALLLAGCAGAPKALENRLACTPEGQPWVLSKWWLFAIGTELAKADAAACGMASPELKK